MGSCRSKFKRNLKKDIEETIKIGVASSTFRKFKCLMSKVPKIIVGQDYKMRTIFLIIIFQVNKNVNQKYNIQIILN